MPKFKTTPKRQSKPSIAMSAGNTSLGTPPVSCIHKSGKLVSTPRITRSSKAKLEGQALCKDKEKSQNCHVFSDSSESDENHEMDVEECVSDMTPQRNSKRIIPSKDSKSFNSSVDRKCMQTIDKKQSSLDPKKDGISVKKTQRTAVRSKSSRQQNDHMSSDSSTDEMEVEEPVLKTTSLRKSTRIIQNKEKDFSNSTTKRSLRPRNTPSTKQSPLDLNKSCSSINMTSQTVHSESSRHRIMFAKDKRHTPNRQHRMITSSSIEEDTSFEESAKKKRTLRSGHMKIHGVDVNNESESIVSTRTRSKSIKLENMKNTVSTKDHFKSTEIDTNEQDSDTVSAKITRSKSNSLEVVRDLDTSSNEEYTDTDSSSESDNSSIEDSDFEDKLVASKAKRNEKTITRKSQGSNLTERPNNDNDHSPTQSKQAFSAKNTRLGTFSSQNPLTSYSEHKVTEDVVEEYFSSRTLKRSKMSQSYPLLDPVLVERLATVKISSYKSGFDALHHMYDNLFDYWLCQLKTGFNILLYGLGSKLKLLDEFRKKKLSTCYQLVIYGFFPGLSLKEILNTLTSDMLEHTGRFKTPVQQSQFICTSLCNQQPKTAKEIFLIIHNIDGKPLRDEKVQLALSFLASCPFIHIIATIDHPRAPSLWDEITSGRFNWVWHNASTYSHYTVETSYDKSLSGEGSEILMLRSFRHVIQSLTPNAKGVFRILAQYQLDNASDPTYIGLPFSDLYQKCREAFLVNSDMTLRAQLTEFRDHKLVRSKKGQDGTEILTISIENDLLKRFMEQEFNNEA